MTLSERLKLSMVEANINQVSLAERVGISQAAIQKLTSGRAKSSRKIVDIAKELGVRPEWLSAEDGPMRDGDPAPAIKPEESSDVFRVDVLDLTVSAGPGSYMLSEFVEVLHAIEFTSEHARALFGNRAQNDVKVMTVDGDSMSPTIRSGDRLFFDVSVQHFKVDGVYAFSFGPHFHVKRLQMQGMRLAVLSDNPAYENWYITEETESNLCIMGKAMIHESIMYNKL